MDFFPFLAIIRFEFFLLEMLNIIKLKFFSKNIDRKFPYIFFKITNNVELIVFIHTLPIILFSFDKQIYRE